MADVESGLLSGAPPFYEAPLQWGVFFLAASFGAGTPVEQIVSSILLATVAYVSAAFGAVVTIFAALLFTLTALWGLARLAYYGYVNWRR